MLSPNSFPKHPIILTPEEQLRIFKVHNEVYVRYDSKIYTNAWNPNMNKMVGKKYSIVRVITCRNVGFGSRELYDGFQPNDLIVYLNLDNINIYFFHYKSLFHPIQMIPNYKPRRKKNERI